MADGSIRVQTKLETKPAEADLAKLEKECKKTAKEIEKVGTKIKTAFTGDSGMKKLGDDCEKTAAKMNEVGKSAQSVFTGMSKGQLNSAFKTANKELEKTKAALAAVDSQISDVEAKTDEQLPKAATDDQAGALLDMEAQETAPLLQQREELAAKAAEYKQLMESITAELDKQTQEEEAQKALKTSGKQAAADAEWVGKIKTQKQYDEALSSTKAKMAAIEKEAARISKETGVSKDKLLQQNAEYQKLSGRLTALTNHTKKFGKAGEDAGKKAKKGMEKASKGVNGFGKALQAGIKKVGKLALAVVGIRAAYNAVRKAASAYMEDNEQMQQQLSAMWNVAGQAMAPFIDAMMEGLSTAIVWINSLVKALSGVDLIAKANAAALKKQAKATKEASQAAQLAGFDEMNKLSDSSSSSSGSTAELFDTSMAADMPSFLEKLKEQIVAGDWGGIGKDLADGLNKAIKSIDWAKAGGKLGDIIQGMFDFVHNFVTTFDFAQFAASLGEGLMGMWRAIDWGQLGTTIIEVLWGMVEFIGGFLGAIDWGQIAEDLSLFIRNLVQTLTDKITSTDWAMVAEKILRAIGSFLANIDVGGILKDLAALIGAIIGGLIAALKGAGQVIGEFCAELWNDIVDYFSQYVDWGGTPGEIIAGLWAGIKDAFKNAGDWLYDNIWVPFRDAFKAAFGIASPSKKMAEFGEFIVQGLYNGIGDIWAKISEIFTTFKNKVSGWFTDRATDFKSWGASIASGLKTGIGNLWSKIMDAFTKVKTSITTWATSLLTYGKAAGTKLANGFKEGFDGVKDFIKKPINAIIGFFESAINWIIKQLNKLSWEIPDWVPLIGGETFGFDMDTISISRLAKGGIVNNPGRGVPAIVGEAGAEAVLPLENNTGWMDMLAERINGGAGNVVIPIYLNGKKISEEIINLTQKRKFATNGAF